MRRRTQTILAAAFVVILIGGVAAWALWRERSARAAAKSTGELEGAIALSGPSMGSTWMVRLPHLPAGVAPQTVQSAVQAVLDSVEEHMSTYRPKSDLSRFNQTRSTDWFPVHEDVARVADAARQVADQTGGAFDVTVGPLVNLWGFGPIHPAGPFETIPPDPMIQEARKHVGYHLLEVRLSPPALRKSDPLLYVDLSGIAKGFAAEQVARRLEQMGITDYLIAVGGEMRAHGHSQAGRYWRVGIETPTPGVRRVLYQLDLRTGSLSTSGDYRNFFDSGGRRYCHEIDPSTGWPVADAPASVSVVDPSGAYADAMATALMVLGADKGYALAEQKGLAVLFIIRRSDHFEARATPAFQTVLVGLGK
jgi:thiamine biosynthesis lipoprotein